jgi:hypothetical protein
MDLYLARIQSGQMVTLDRNTQRTLDGWRGGSAEVALLTAVTILSWLSTIVWPEPARPELDPSWQQILVDAWINGLRFGHDLVFTWGPLGFLLNTFYLPDALQAKLLFETIGRLTIAAMWVGLAAPLSLVRRLGLVAALALFSHNMFDATAVALIPAIVAAWLVRGRSLASASAAVAALAALALVKFTLLILVAATIGILVPIMLLDRKPWRTLYVAAGVMGATVIWWIAAGQHIGDFVSWIRLSLEVASSYPSAMGLLPTRAYAIGGAVALVAHATWIVPHCLQAPTHRDRLLVIGLVLIPLALAWKHGFTRADGHVNHFFLSSLLLALLAPLLAGGSRWSHSASLLAIAASLLAFELAAPGMLAARPREAMARVLLSAQRIAHPSGFASDFRRRFDDQAAAARLPEEAMARIGSDPVDLIGYSQGLLHLNGLHHRTRPIIQSYSAYNEVLAERDRAFLASDHAPIYLIATLETIDGRYAAQDDARLLAEMPRRYETVYDEPRGLLARRRAVQPEAAVRLEGELVLEADLLPGQAIQLPADRSAAQWIRITALPTLRGRLLGAILSTPSLRMTTQDDTSATNETRVIPSLAESGFLIQPRLTGPSDLIGWMRGKGRRWNTRLTLGTGPNDSANWQVFHVRVSRLAELPLEHEGFREIGVANVEPTGLTSGHPWPVLVDETGPRLILHAPGEPELPVPTYVAALRVE